MNNENIQSSAEKAGEGNKRRSKSYEQVLKASTIVGGAKVLTIFIALARTKAAAIILGPSGIGLLGLYTAVSTVLATISSGLANGSVKAIAESAVSPNKEKLGKTVDMVQRIAMLTGIFGTVIAVGFAPIISEWTFRSEPTTINQRLKLSHPLEQFLRSCQGPSSGSGRVNRGGSWNDDAGLGRSADRDLSVPGRRGNNLGFRPALSSVR